MTKRLVVGPPGAGKNTYVEKNKKPQDMVVDLDQLVGITGDLESAKMVRDTMINGYNANESPSGDLWVIRSVGTSTPEERKAYAEKVKADETVVIETPLELAKERITKRDRPGDKDKDLLSAVDAWWATYGVVESDLIVRPDQGDIRQEPKKMSKEQNQDKGFPPETPVAEMDDKQAAAYWKYHSRRHENMVKELSEPFGNDVTKLKEHVGTYVPPAPASDVNTSNDIRLVKAEFKAAVAGKVTKEVLDTFLEDMDLTKFFKEDGEVDEARVTAKALLIAPAGNQRRVPGDNHLGDRNGGNQGETGVEAGRSLFNKFKDKK